MKGVTSVITKIDKNASRKKRHARVRSKITGTAERPRLNVFRSNKYIYAQLIDDVTGTTLVSASSLEKDFAGESTSNVEAAAKIGETIAKRATEKNVTSIVFDRGGYLYHGRVKALAEAARENGLEF
nr:50S ribosomal protein L18 [Planomicrobium sp. YIM 101495]